MVVLGSGRRIAVAEAIQLFRVDRKHSEASLHEGFYNRTPRDFNADRQTGWLLLADVQQPVHQSNQACPAVLGPPPFQHLSGSIHTACSMLLRSPIDA